MKTPEEYIADSVFIPEEDQRDGQFTDAEQAFLEKYLGTSGEAFLAKVPRVDPRGIDVGDGAADAARTPSARAPEAAPAPRAAPEQEIPASPSESEADIQPDTTASEPDKAEGAQDARPEPAKVAEAGPSARSVSATPAQVAQARDAEKEELRAEEGLQLVSFLLDSREMALPIQCIQEVIRYVEPTKLPSAPAFVAGVINLRGKVTPLLNLRAMMSQRGGQDASDNTDRFIVVCRHKGLQVGLIVTTISTMYRPPARDIEWNVESQVGISSDFVAGLMKKEDKLINILSIDRLVDKVIAR